MSNLQDIRDVMKCADERHEDRMRMLDLANQYHKKWMDAESRYQSLYGWHTFLIFVLLLTWIFGTCKFTGVIP